LGSIQEERCNGSTPAYLFSQITESMSNATAELEAAIDSEAAESSNLKATEISREEAVSHEAAEATKKLQGAATLLNLQVWKISGESLSLIEADPSWTASDVIQKLQVSTDVEITHLIMKGAEGPTIWKETTVAEVVQQGLVVQAIAGSCASQHIKAAHTYILSHGANGNMSSDSLRAVPFSDALVEDASLHVAKLDDISKVQLSTLREGKSSWTGGVKDGSKHGFGYDFSYTVTFYEMDNRDCTSYFHVWAVYQDGAALWKEEIHRSADMFHS